MSQLSKPRRVLPALAAVGLLATLLLASAGDAARPEKGGSGHPGKGAGGGGKGNKTPPARPYTGPPIDTGNSDRCDFLDAAVCLQPWPNDHFTVEDGATDTGRRVNLNLLSMPANQPLGSPVPVKPIDPSEQNRNDGFSPGNMIVTRVPGLDNPQAFANTGAVSIDDPGAYDDPDQPIVVINAATGERHPVWAEIDFNPIDPAEGGADTPENRAKVNLLIRPLVNFEEGARYVVALRDLRDENGDAIEPADAFRVYRDNLITAQPEVEARRPHMEELFSLLRKARVKRSNLYLSWDFTVASERNLSERMLSIRDRAFEALGDADLADGTIQGDPPAFTIDAVENLTAEQDDRIARRVTGTMTVPCFMNNGCAPAGGTYNYPPGTDPDRLPAQNGTTEVQFTCRIPRVALDGPEANPGRASLYGHGLLGSAGEVNAGNVRAMANEHNFTFCATDWYGFAAQNIPNILAILQDLSLFPLLADGSQQGVLNFLYLGRLMAHPQGLATDPAFQGPDGPDADSNPDPVIETGQLFYDGNSQGGILGGSLTAVAPDFQRAVLGVPGMNYSTLLRRSVDFEPYAEGQFGEEVEDAICEQADQIPEPTLAQLVEELCVAGVPDDTPLGLYDNYPNELERPLIISLIQMLWDRGEANGYAHHMTGDPLPNTPSHDVLLHVAFGDHQVANVTAEVEARTIGASVYQPALDPGRHWELDGSDPLFGLPAVPSFPFGGSALVYWDGGPIGFPGGTATPPNENIPPRPDQGFGEDPHGYPRNDPLGRIQKSAFLRNGGELVNPCSDGGVARPCYANGWGGPP
ncbi:MAG: hypothetical protein ACRDL6_02710 [Solirubrobacterales bacterium]